MVRVTVLPLSLEDYVALEYRPPKYSTKGFSFYLNEKLVGIAGVFFKGPDAIAFARATQDLRDHPLILYRVACTVMAFIQTLGLPVTAIADKTIPRSEATLEWFGFEHTGSTEHGEVYEWMPDRAQT